MWFFQSMVVEKNLHFFQVIISFHIGFLIIANLPSMKHPKHNTNYINPFILETHPSNPLDLAMLSLPPWPCLGLLMPIQSPLSQALKHLDPHRALRKNQKDQRQLGTWFEKRPLTRNCMLETNLHKVLQNWHMLFCWNVLKCFWKIFWGSYWSWMQCRSSHYSVYSVFSIDICLLNSTRKVSQQNQHSGFVIFPQT